MPLTSKTKRAAKRTRHFGESHSPAIEPPAVPATPAPLETTISAPVIPEHREDIQAQYKFLPEELTQMERELRGALDKADLLEDQKKACMQDFKLRITNVENDAKRLRNMLGAGEETRPMRAAVEFDAKRGMKRYLDPQTGAFIQEAPMQPADWQLPLFKLQETAAQPNQIASPIPNATDIIAQAILDYPDEAKLEHHFETLYAYWPAHYAGGKKKAGLKMFMQDVADAADRSPAEGGAEEKGQGKTSVGSALDKVAADTKVPLLLIDLAKDDYNSKGLMNCFKLNAKKAGWNPAQINVLRDELLKKGEDVEGMKDTLRPYTKGADWEEFVPNAPDPLGVPADAEGEQDAGDTGMPE